MEGNYRTGSGFNCLGFCMGGKIKYPRYFVPLKYWDEIIRYIKFNSDCEREKAVYINFPACHISHEFGWTVKELEKCVKEKSWREVATKEELALIV